MGMFWRALVSDTDRNMDPVRLLAADLTDLEIGLELDPSRRKAPAWALLEKIRARKQAQHPL